MGKGWDNSGIAFQKETWRKCYEVLKPGGYLLAFGGSRTFHRIAVAIEDAGFEIRDTIMWLYGSGFPKSMNIGLAIDKKNGIDNTTGNIRTDGKATDSGSGVYNCNNGADTMKREFEERIAQNEWNGWGTALKPSYEPVIVARKPCEGSVINNVEKYGVGGINIDGCRIGDDVHTVNVNDFSNQHGNQWGNGEPIGKLGEREIIGRFPANTILTYDETDEQEVCGGMPESKGASSQNNYSDGHIYRGQSLQESSTSLNGYREWYNDDGSASRYFYCAKASKRDRDEGLKQFSDKNTGELQGGRKEGSAGSIMLNADGSTRVNPYAGTGAPKKNVHPTVKPVDLMQYLVRLVAPPHSTILDPFNGSGSTGKAVMYENKDHNSDYKYIGIELTEEYLPISKARIEYAINDKSITEKQKELLDEGQMTLF